MEKPAWVPATVIVGADGCRYQDDGSAQLYANQPSVATNTNYFVQQANHTVIVCLAFNKMGDGPKSSEGQQSGPPIYPPKNPRVRRIIVTDKEPGTTDIREAFGRDSWVILTPQTGWPPDKEDVSKWLKTRLSEITPARRD